MASTVLWLVGPPGVGKTTLARKLMGAVKEHVAKPKFTVAEHAVAAGHYTGAVFDGADTVPYNGAAQVLDLWEQLFIDQPLLLLDGDRFSNATAKARLSKQAGRLLCLRLDAPGDVLADRRAARGSNQNPSWMAGRTTKAFNFWSGFDEADRLLVRADSLDMEATVRQWLTQQGV